MNNQPIIIEQIIVNQSKIHPSHMEGELFFEVLDQAEKYDSMTTQIRKMHQNAMLELAAIKFIDPNSLNTNAHRCLPAFLKVSDGFQLKYGYSSFVQKSQDIIDEEQFDEQEAIEKECLEKQVTQAQKQKKGENIQTLKQSYIDNEIIYRFNALNQQEKILSTAQHFKHLLEKLIELSRLKYQIDQQFINLQSIQKQ